MRYKVNGLLSLTSPSSIDSLFIWHLIIKSAASMRDWFGSCLWTCAPVNLLNTMLKTWKFAYFSVANELNYLASLRFFFACIKKWNVLWVSYLIYYLVNLSRMMLSVIPWTYCVSIDLHFWKMILNSSCQTQKKNFI